MEEAVMLIRHAFQQNYFLKKPISNKGQPCTSAIIDTEIGGAVGMNSGIFNNPFII